MKFASPADARVILQSYECGEFMRSKAKWKPHADLSEGSIAAMYHWSVFLFLYHDM